MQATGRSVNDAQSSSLPGGSFPGIGNAAFNNSIPSILNNSLAAGSPSSLWHGNTPTPNLSPPKKQNGAAQEVPSLPEERSHKRQKTDSSRQAMSYPRRRAVTACQLCRTRKTKCSNERPICSSCATLGAECLYESRSDHSSFDPASLLILERLNDIITRLDDGVKVDVPEFSPMSMVTPENAGGSIGTAIGSSPTRFSHDRDAATRGGSRGVNLQEEDASTFDYLKIPSSRATPDSVLTWPIFENRFGPDSLTESLFIPEKTDAAISEDTPLQRPEMKTRRQTYGMHDEDVPGLVNRFLRYVHIKNPILDVRTIREYARRVSENGPQWDAPSCLVLLACALGAMAKPFDSTVVPGPGSTFEANSIDRDADARETAELYFSMARKRFGLLDRTIITSQCYLLSGVYLMYKMQPLKAWTDFLNSSINYHVYLKCQIANTARLPYLRLEDESKTRRLEQRLYWTCFKSECEIRAELSLPESGISDLRYPYMFPSPPSPGSPVAQDRNLPENISITAESPQSGSTLQRTNSIDEGLQQSWFYYLTEISLRRIGNRIINAYYQGDHTSWSKMPLPEMTKIAEQFETQLSEWYEGLPEPIAYDNESTTPLDELRWLVKARMLEMKNWLYRPFLYYAIHCNADPQTHALAEKGLETSLQNVDAVCIRHRHHGTWYACRVSATAALALIAAKKSGQIKLPVNWEVGVRKSIDSLAYWAKESPDLAKSRDVVQSLYDEVRDS